MQKHWLCSLIPALTHDQCNIVCTLYRCSPIKNCHHPWSCNRSNVCHDCYHHLTIYLDGYNFAQIQASFSSRAQPSQGQNERTTCNLWGNCSIARLPKIIISNHWCRREYSICVSHQYECLYRKSLCKAFYVNKTVSCTHDPFCNNYSLSRNTATCKLSPIVATYYNNIIIYTSCYRPVQGDCWMNYLAFETKLLL